MAEYIAPIIDGVLAVLQARTPAALGAREPFREFGKVFKGVVNNPPSVWVQPKGTSFNPEGTATDEVHEIEITVAVSAGDPDVVAEMAMAYVAAVTAAIGAADLVEFWPGADPEIAGVRRVFVADHDYGPLRSTGSGFGALPVLSLVVETTEL